MQVDNAYILGTKKYLETSLILSILSKEYGIISAVAKGALRPKSQQQSIFQPFQLISFTLSGNRSLRSLYKPEIIEYQPSIPSELLLSALYANELLLKLLAEQDPHPRSYKAYCILLEQLRSPIHSPAYYLRTFEWFLFADCGYELNCNYDLNNQPIEKDTYYNLNNNWQFTPSLSGTYQGKDLLLINEYKFESCFHTAKKLSRDIIFRIVGPKGLKSWRIFAQPKNNNN